MLGHAVYLSEEDIALLAEKDAFVTHHASCNLIMRDGIAPGLLYAEGRDECGHGDG